ncbi:MAG: GumC family protein [Bacteroidota bacterium]
MLDRIAGGRAFEGEGGSRNPLEISITPADILRFLLSNALVILGCIAVAVITVYFYLATVTPLYTARAELFIDSRSPQFLREQLGEGAIVLDLGQIESQIAVLQSEQIALLVINKLNLLTSPEIHLESGHPEHPEGIEAGRLRAAVDAFQRGLEIRRKGVSYVIEVGYSASNPQRAALLANATADAFIEDQLGARAQAARRGSQWLEERIEEIRQLMNGAALKVQEFKARRDYRIIGTRDPDPDGKSKDGHDRAQEASTARSTLEELESTAMTYRKMYESYLQAYTESVQRQSYPGTNARVISRATPPVKPSYPRYLRSLAAAGAAGCVLGIGIGLLRLAFGGPRPDTGSSKVV